jgi:hypothetical protein
VMSGEDCACVRGALPTLQSMRGLPPLLLSLSCAHPARRPRTIRPILELVCRVVPGRRTGPAQRAPGARPTGSDGATCWRDKPGPRMESVHITRSGSASSGLRLSYANPARHPRTIGPTWGAGSGSRAPPAGRQARSGGSTTGPLTLARLTRAAQHLYTRTMHNARSRRHISAGAAAEVFGCAESLPRALREGDVP